MCLLYTAPEFISILDVEYKDQVPSHPHGGIAICQRTLKIYLGGQTLDVELFALPSQSPLPMGLNSRPMPTGNALSIKAIDWVKEQLSSCALDHNWCGDGSATLLPDRVIDVGS